MKSERFGSCQPLARDFLRAGALLVIFLSGVCTAFVCQASSPDYRALFWFILPVALFHLALVVVYFGKVGH
jgi:hypothetical protein